ncbi:hypothetical protein KC973_01025 [Candidatus Saccharibacteria bacterium]|nr:hypothetical protein [Candidatus Saccharibacteria bacterium]
MATNTSAQDSQTKKHHYARTTLAVVFGVLATWLLLFGVVTTWLNRAVTDTNTYVATVEPLSQQDAVKDFIITKVDEQLRQSASGVDLATFTLPEGERIGKTDEQLKAAAITSINETISQTLDSEAFQSLWRASIRTAHKQLVTQLDSDSDTATFNMGPTITGAIVLLEDTKLAPLIARLDLPDSRSFNIKLQSERLASVRNAYKLFKQGTILLIIVALVCLALAVTLSVHHVKTLRRIVLGSGVGLLLVWVAVTTAPSKIAANSDASSKALIEAVADVLLRDLRLTTLIAGTVFISIGVLSEVYDLVQARKTKSVTK